MDSKLVRVSLHPPRDGGGWLSIAPATARVLPSEVTDGVTLFAINCKGGQKAINNGGGKPAARSSSARLHVLKYSPQETKVEPT